MKSIEQMIKDMYQKKADRGWDTLYWLVDVHDTIIKGSYDTKDEFAETYPYCFAALQLISDRTDCKLVLWTSSRKKYAKSFMKWMEEYRIDFDYFNRNPECKNTETGDFSKKFYFNIILDDKSGFEPDNDWKEVLGSMKEIQNVY